MQDNEIHRHVLPRRSITGSTFEHINNLLDAEDYDAALGVLTEMHHADLADFLDNADTRSHKKVMTLLGSAFKAETLVWLSPSTKHSIAAILSQEDIAELLESLDIEDAIEVLEDFGSDEKVQILQHLTKDKRLQIIEGLTYPDHTVGRVMEKNFVSFLEYWTVGQAMDYIRRSHDKLHDFHAAIIVDTRQRPVGSLLLCDLLKHKRSDIIKDIMNDDLRIADTYTNLDQLSYIFKRYALTIVPIVNKIGKIVGIMSINNMLYIVEQQTEEEFMPLGGVHVKDTFHSVLHTSKHRFPWLFMNLATACLTAIIIHGFSDTILQIISLAAIMPVVASLGGNAATQAMTVTVMALVSNEINQRNMTQVIFKELLVCGINGFVLACIGGSTILGIFSDVGLSLVFGLAVVINSLVAGFFGSFVPIILDKMQYDPAAASAVLVSTITDILSFFIFLILAYFLLI